MKPAYVLQPADYIGELNLNAMERRIIIRELKKTQDLDKALILLKFSLRTMFRKILAHQIKKSEWQTPKAIKTKTTIPRAVKLKPWKNTL